MDWRVYRSFLTLQPTALLYREDSSAAARAAVLDSYEAIVNDLETRVAPLLGSQAVKYVVVDLADRQEPGDPWQTGQRTVAHVSGTNLLAGNVARYLDVLKKTPGLQVERATSRYIIYRNLDWQSMLSQFSGVLTVSSTGPASVVEGGDIKLAWNAP